jgi:hypothetical protein
MADIQALKLAVDQAEAAKEILVEERRANRESMTKAEFKAYNTSTYQEQIDVEKAVGKAISDLQAALNAARQELLVGTVGESEGSPNG